MVFSPRKFLWEKKKEAINVMIVFFFFFSVSNKNSVKSFLK